MKVIKMRHKHSDATITIVESQLSNAQYYGWYAFDEEPETAKETLKPSKARKEDGKSKRR